MRCRTKVFSLDILAKCPNRSNIEHTLASEIVDAILPRVGIQQIIVPQVTCMFRGFLDSRSTSKPICNLMQVLELVYGALVLPACRRAETT